MDTLYKELENYSQKDYYPFHMPGHKRNPFTVDTKMPFERDITEIDGFDNLHHPEGILKRAQEAAARLYGTPECFYSVNGSTAALLAAVSAAVKRGGKLLVARNCHKAVYNAMYLRDLEPVYLYPQTECELGINGEIFPEDVDKFLKEDAEIEAVLVTSPTYDGIVSDIRRIADTAHRYDVPLIVDEAHGAHFHFSEYFPVSAAELGADLVIQSLHKTLPAMTQTAVIHRCSDRVDRDKLCRFLGIYQSSSPSYILMASIDACVDKLSRDGDNMFREFTENLEAARQRLSRCKKIRLFSPVPSSERACPSRIPGQEDGISTTGASVFDFDRSKIILSTKGTALTGKQFHRILREKYHLQMEMESEHYVLAMATVGDTREGFDRLCNAVEEIDRLCDEAEKAGRLRDEAEEAGRPYDEMEEIDRNKAAGSQNQQAAAGDTEGKEGRLRQVMRISEAMEAPSVRYPLEESIGKISAEFVYLYPPGIPILAPGEEITGLFVSNVRRYIEEGLDLQGLSDYTNKTICVAVQ
ncbi:MAG: aminotransferase class I/II-fold pyridoxal phosphate-dependent enzyme [Eubacteriales bacterium]|nr:aminotransferase class I/II-fold pyridoxal phosphate-dependent enzyme [Eubacteriales bacterium]